MSIKRINDTYLDCVARKTERGIVRLFPMEKDDSIYFPFSSCTGSKVIVLTAPKNAVVYHGPIKMPEARHYLFCFEQKYSNDNTVQAGILSENDLESNGSIDLTQLCFISPKDSVRVLSNILSGNLRLWQGIAWHLLFNPFLTEEKVKNILDDYKTQHIHLSDELEGFLRTRFRILKP